MLACPICGKPINGFVRDHGNEIRRCRGIAPDGNGGRPCRARLWILAVDDVHAYVAPLLNKQTEERIERMLRVTR